MEFEFDFAKSVVNLQKHQICFVEAQEIWKDPLAITVSARSESEPRLALIGKYKERLWSVFYTLRENKYRIISVRRARENEEKLYYESRRTR